MRASQLDDPLYDPDDLDQPEPMRPIRLQYVTLSSEKQLLTDTCERLGLVHVWVRQNLFALSECDSNAIRLTAIELLAHDGNREPIEHEVTRRAEALLLQLVLEQSFAVAVSALHDPETDEPLSEELAALVDETRAQYAVSTAARRAGLAVRVAARIAEIEAA